MAVLDLVRLADQQKITTTSAVKLVENPATKKTVILEVLCQNISLTEFVEVRLFRVPDNGGTTGTLDESEHLLPYPIEFKPDNGNVWQGKVILQDNGDSFWIKCSVANTILISIDGLQN